MVVGPSVVLKGPPFILEVPPDVLVVAHLSRNVAMGRVTLKAQLHENMDRLCSMVALLFGESRYIE